MTLWRPTLSDRRGPLFQRIAEALADAVMAGELPPGTRLPPQRDLAFDLGVSLQTVSRAYAEAITRGFARGEVGRGTYVRGPVPAPAPPPPADLARPTAGPIDLARGLPTPGHADADLARTLTALAGTNALAGLLDDQTGATEPTGAAEAGAQWMARLGLDAAPERIVLTCGAQHGLLSALMATTRPGGVLLTDALTYAPIRAMAEHLGLRLVPVAAVPDGCLDPDALDAACRRVSARALFCMPTLHTPTTATWSDERRAAIAAIARRHDLTLIEDDVFGALPPERPRPLATHAPERTLVLASTSKSLGPGLRIGYVHGPADRITAVRAAATLSGWMVPPLMAEIARRWVQDGTADRLNATRRADTAARQALARARLPADLCRSDPHGFHVWLTLPPGWHPDVFRLEAQARGVAVVSASVFAVDPTAVPAAVRLCLTHERAPERVATGLDIIADLLRSPPPREQPVV
ncbi:PLP-dependent aminotransferase family protein [Roseospira marina]|uniref:PLP-dependent aminotransferase family protein n=1 Tax=Roseospira marina TaxID=140057 RepID=A0A5M6IC76_9PROT|nr:PLP-dependent aminotransferase family protein [Roseospira marina]KAA5605567.1 PLP-dependent aminotransferase family protein [Roseospira marina]MBB4313370.1 DNA-binding transcriptional MocR family regulator [Roseospira marina]MBB5085889.1 DNA-binding transcriptional MocR family regulator [Roseospira marina]